MEMYIYSHPRLKDWTAVFFSLQCKSTWLRKHFLFVHRLVGGLLTLSSEYGFVLEDDEGICGYALGTVDVKPFVKKCKLNWIPFMQEKYNKPDCQKDLTEAEVGSSSISLTIITLVSGAIR